MRRTLRIDLIPQCVKDKRTGYVRFGSSNRRLEQTATCSISTNSDGSYIFTEFDAPQDYSNQPYLSAAYGIHPSRLIEERVVLMKGFNQVVAGLSPSGIGFKTPLVSTPCECERDRCPPDLRRALHLHWKYLRMFRNRSDSVSTIWASKSQQQHLCISGLPSTRALSSSSYSIIIISCVSSCWSFNPFDYNFLIHASSSAIKASIRAWEEICGDCYSSVLIGGGVTSNDDLVDGHCEGSITGGVELTGSGPAEPHRAFSESDTGMLL
ncbi:hypothetical protein Tco_0639791 [Tanacetum coccineum]